MVNKGWSHVSLSTLDMDKTLAFYVGVLGFPAVRCDIIKITEGGQLRHVFVDTGNNQLLAFMEGRDIPGVAAPGSTEALGSRRASTTSPSRLAAPSSSRPSAPS